MAAAEPNSLPGRWSYLAISLKPEQERTLQKFVTGHDVCVSLPTG